MPAVIDPLREADWVVETARMGEQHRLLFEDFFRYNQTQKSMEEEARKITSTTNQLGWSKTRRMKRIACMPKSLFILLREFDPEITANTKEGHRKMDRFLLRHPEFSVR